MEADRVSLFTDFSEMMYNVFFKRKLIVGFDEKGFPIIGELPVKNGDVDPDLVTKEPLAYPEPDYPELPFTSNPYEYWSDDFVDPYSYPNIESWDFPKAKENVRFRVPGRAHLQNSYPLTQFGYTDPVKGRHRRTLPLPVKSPVPKKLPQLMFRKEEELSLEQALKNAYGIKTPKYTGDTIAINPKEKLLKEDTDAPEVPLLPPRKKSAKVKSTKVHNRPMTSVGERRNIVGPTPPSATQLGPLRSSRPVSAMNGSVPHSTGRQSRAMSAFSPRSILTDRSTPRPATSIKRDTTGSVGFNIEPEESPRSKPPRIFLPPETPETPITPRSVPKSALRREGEERPMTGRKSVTIVDNMTPRPSTAATDLPPLFELSPFNYNRPSSSAMSARETIVAPHSARPRSERHVLPPQLTSAYRPASCGARPMTPAEHPAPYLHPGVNITKTSDYSMFNTPPMTETPRPPSEHKMKFVPPPMPFVTKPQPKKRKRKEEIASIVTKSGNRIAVNLDSDSDDDINAPLFSFGNSPREGTPSFARRTPDDKLPFLPQSRRSKSRKVADTSTSVFGDGPLFDQEMDRSMSRTSFKSLKSNGFQRKNSVSPE